MAKGKGCPKYAVLREVKLVKRPGMVQEIHGDALSARVQLELGLLTANCPKQLLQMRAILQRFRQA